MSQYEDWATLKSHAINIESIEKEYEKSWNISFYNYYEQAKMGYKYKNDIMNLINK